jgi:hypothetical protein
MDGRRAIRLEPVAMTARVMQRLEDRGLIVRLGPGRHWPAAPAGRTVDEPLYLVVALHRREELERIVRERRLSAEDFLALRVRFNDRRVSFFVMLEHTPRGEAAAAGPGRPPRFYVTESRDLPVERFALQGYSLAVQG